MKDESSAFALFAVRSAGESDTFNGGGQMAVVEHDAEKEDGMGAVVGYATHAKAFARRSNIQFVLTVPLLAKPEEDDFDDLPEDRSSWTVRGEVAFTVGAGELSDQEKMQLYGELRGEELALGVSERKQVSLIKVSLSQSVDGIQLEMDVTAKAQLLKVFDDVKVTRGRWNPLTLYLCRDCASLDHFRNRQLRKTTASNGADGPPLLHVLRLKYPEPYALVRKDVLEKLKEGVAASDRAFGQTEIFKCVNMAKMDTYMTWEKRSGAKKGGKDLHDFRQNWSANKKSSGNPHSDAVRDDDGSSGYEVEDGVRRHVRRFLLFAECQIGKTGTYLALLHSLYKIIRQNAGAALPRDGDGCTGVVIVAGPTQRVPGAIAWKIPHWFDIASMPTPPYGRLGVGKYIVKFARIRFFCLLGAIQTDPGRGWSSWLER